MNNKKHIPIIFICEEINIKNLAVALISLLENAGKSTKYDVYILSKIAYSVENQFSFNFEIPKKYDFNLNFNVYSDIKNDNFYEISTTIATFYNQIDRCIYLDCNVVVQKDLYDLFNFNLNNSYVAGVKQIGNEYIAHNVMVIDCVALRKLQNNNMLSSNLSDENTMISEPQLIGTIDLKYNLSAYYVKNEYSFNFGNNVDINTDIFKVFNQNEIFSALSDNVIFSYNDSWNPFVSLLCSFFDVWDKYYTLSKFY